MEQQTLISDQAEPAIEGEVIPAGTTIIEGANSRWTNRVTKSNKLITSFSVLSLAEQKLLSAVISKLNPTSERRPGEKLGVELHATEIRDLTGIPLSYVYEFIDKAARAYHSIPIETPGKKPGTISYINIAHRSDYDPDTRMFRMIFHEELLDELVGLTKYFTSYHLGPFTKLKTKYGGRLFENLKLIADIPGTKTFYIWEPSKPDMSLYYVLGLRNGLGKDVRPSYTAGFREFRKYVLDRAVDDVNQNSDISTHYVVHKQGKTVHRVQFFVTKKILKESALQFAVQLGISAKSAQALVLQYEEAMLVRNLTVLEQRLKTGKIKKPESLLKFLLDNNIADLPDLANPFAPRYRQNADQREFVKDRLMPIWWKMPDQVREHLLCLGFTDPVLAREFGIFKKARNDSSVGLFEECMLLEHEFIEELIDSCNKINGTNLLPPPEGQ